MTRVVFETAALADAIKAAARIAPSKSGHAFDKAAGIVLDIFPNNEVQCVVRATNTDVFSAEIVAVVEVEGPEVSWRMSSMVLASVIGSLSISSGQTVTFTQKAQGGVLISSGRMKATLNLMDASYFPTWDPFDPDGLTQVNGIGGKIELVEWAAAVNGKPPLSGVHLDGEYAIASDRYVIARVPLRLDLPRPITIPAGILGSVIKSMGDVGVGVRTNTLELAIGDYHQLQTIIFDAEFPNLTRIMNGDRSAKVEVHKGALLDMLNRANQFAGADRSPLLKVIFGRGEVAAMMENVEIGLLGDVIECPGQIPHPRVTLGFTPKNLINAISKAPSTKVTLGYEPEMLNGPFYIEDGSGYQAWVVPRKLQVPQIQAP